MKKSLLLLLLLAAPTLAQAHTGAGQIHGLIDGLTHPIFGLDHVLAMVAVGLWAAQLGRRAFWVVPASFVGMMAVGGILGMAGIALPMVETGILVSIFLLGLMIVFAVKLPLWAGSTLVALFALCHGFAHGAEMPTDAHGALYAAGFILATAALHLTGMGAGLALKTTAYAPALRISGGVVLILGSLLILT